MNLTRVSRGKIELHYEVVDAHALLRTLLRDFESEIDSRDIVLTIGLGAREKISGRIRTGYSRC